MDISIAKDKIKEIIRRSSLKNYFSPFIPRRQKYNRATRHQSDKSSVLDSQKLNLNLLAPQNRPKKLLPLVAELNLNNKKFIQLSSKQLEFPEMQARKGMSKSYLFKDLSTFPLPNNQQTERRDHCRNMLSSQVLIKLSNSPDQALKNIEKKPPSKELKRPKKDFSFINIKKIKHQDTSQHSSIKLQNPGEKFTSVGENTLDSQLIPWEDENFPTILFY